MKKPFRSSSHRHKDDNGTAQRASRLDSLIQYQERYPALTSDRLEKKNKLDALKKKVMSSKRRHTGRRQSIASGQIFRSVIHHHHLDEPSSRGATESEGSESEQTSDGAPGGWKSNVSSNNSAIGVGTGFVRHYTSSSQCTLPFSHPMSFSEDNRTGLFQSTLGRSVGAASVSLRSDFRPAAGALHFKSRSSTDLLKEKRRLSKFLNLSRFSSSSSPPTKSRHLSCLDNVGLQFLQSSWQALQTQLIKMADRVMDTRSCELSPSTMTVNDICALAKFMQALQKESTTSHALPPPPLERLTSPLLADDYGLHSDRESGDSNHATPQRRRRLGSLSRIFPFTSSFYQEQQQPWIQRTAHRLSWAFGMTTDSDRESVSDSNPFKESASSIQFDGWSLCLFSPSSKTRLYLWMVVASR